MKFPRSVLAAVAVVIAVLIIARVPAHGKDRAREKRSLYIYVQYILHVRRRGHRELRGRSARARSVAPCSPLFEVQVVSPDRKLDRNVSGKFLSSLELEMVKMNIWIYHRT